MKKIILEGWLADYTGYKELNFNVKSVGQAVQLLEANFKGIANKIREGKFYVLRDEVSIPVEEVNMFVPAETFRIIPAVEGSGNSAKGWAYLIIGAVLVVASFYMPQGSYLGMMMMGMGMSMAFGGIALLLAPSTNMSDSGAVDDNKSFMFSGAVNSIEQGGTIGVILGKFGVGSTVIGSALEAKNI